ncbi:MAG: hypothetical protein IT354_03035, partial [Gemmatimonadaceae bacterium]|nr:hypothetical protein [Gemmatimonadaceae bacterium]
MNSIRFRRDCASARHVVALVATAAGLFAAEPLAAQGTTAPSARRARIVGVVTDLNTKQPLVGANILLIGTPVTAT